LEWFKANSEIDKYLVYASKYSSDIPIFVAMSARSALLTVLNRRMSPSVPGSLGERLLRMNFSPSTMYPACTDEIGGSNFERRLRRYYAAGKDTSYKPPMSEEAAEEIFVVAKRNWGCGKSDEPELLNAIASVCAVTTSKKRSPELAKFMFRGEWCDLRPLHLAFEAAYLLFPNPLRSWVRVFRRALLCSIIVTLLKNPENAVIRTKLAVASCLNIDYVHLTFDCVREYVRHNTLTYLESIAVRVTRISRFAMVKQKPKV